MADNWFKTKSDLCIHLLNSGMIRINNEYWAHNKKTVVIMQDKSKSKRGWTFGYL